MLLPFFRCCQVLALLLLLGACQRATYSFQAPGALPAAFPSTSAAPAAAALPVAEAPPATVPATVARQMRPRHPRRPRATAPANAPVVALTRPNLLRALAAAHAARRTVAHQQPLPTGEPVHYRSKGIALLLAVLPLLFLFPLGLYHFYLGYTGRGLGSLALALLAFILALIAFVGSFGALFFGAPTGLLTLFIISAVIYYGLVIQQLVDVVRIILGDLKPKNGEYYPRFFQVRPDADAAPPSR